MFTVVTTSPKGRRVQNSGGAGPAQCQAEGDSGLSALRPHSRAHVPGAARSRRSAPCSRTAARRAPATGPRRPPPRWGPPASFPGRPWLGHTPRGVKSKPRPAPRRLSCLRLSENTSSPRPLYLGLIFRHLLKTRVPSKALTPRVCSQCVCTGTPTREGDPGSAGSRGYPRGLGPQGPLGRLSATLSDSTGLAPGPPTHTGTGGTSLSPALCSPRRRGLSSSRQLWFLF